MHYHAKDLRKGRFSEANRIYLVTSVTQQRQPLFTQWPLAQAFSQTIHEHSRTAGFTTLGWVLMPDHFHWLVQMHEMDLSNNVRQLKSKSSRRINAIRGVQAPVWQKGFHDHALRKDEDIKHVARYLVANPLRAGLAQSVRDWPYWDAIWL